MLQKMRNTNEKGFTLIELMIVIAIIGILAAIAIPNFINYRDKSFCSAAESDANSIASALANYYSIPTRNADPDTLSLVNDLGGPTSGNNDATISETNNVITISVTDASTRCPTEYQSAMDAARNPRGYWSNGAYIKV
ncbi:MAG: prepilin-type N-terminal cleavage/methylation domain-containing protein, partial [Desulfobacterales bacterium]